MMVYIICSVHSFPCVIDYINLISGGNILANNDSYTHCVCSMYYSRAGVIDCYVFGWSYGIMCE